MIDPEILEAGNGIMLGARKALDEILLASGMTKEEIQTVVEEGMDSIRINGIPLRAVACSHCDGNGWTLPARLKKENS